MSALDLELSQGYPRIVFRSVRRCAMGELQVASIGYERRTPDDLVSSLVKHGVQMVLDVRLVPVSRKRGFSKRTLASRLSDAGIGYTHIGLAGNPFKDQKADLGQCLDNYRVYLRGNPSVVRQVADVAAKVPVAVLCYERDAMQCHRSVLIDVIHETVAPVRAMHI
jgi:uncharacterized protein (DUF488 family)